MEKFVFRCLAALSLFSLFALARDAGLKKASSPSCQELTIAFSQRTAGEERAESVLVWTIGLALDSRGNAYVLDLRQEGVLQFSPQGKFLRRIGRRGEGPGEFVNPWAFFVSGSDVLHVLDSGNKAISRFDPEGKYLGRAVAVQSPPDAGGGFVALPNGETALFTYEYTDQGAFHVLQLVSPGGKSREIFRAPDPTVVGKGGQSSGPYSPRAFVCAHGGSFLFGHSLDPNLYTWNKKTGKSEVAATSPMEKTPLSSGETARLKEYAGSAKGGVKVNGQVVEETEVYLPPCRPYYKRVLTDEKGRIYLVRVRAILDEGETTRIDVLDRNGKCLYLAQAPCEPWAIRNGVLLSIASNEEGDKSLMINRILGYDSWKH